MGVRQTIIAISGPPGVGKTTLLESKEFKALQKQGGFWVTFKEPIRGSIKKPFSKLVKNLDEYLEANLQIATTLRYNFLPELLGTHADYLVLDRYPLDALIFLEFRKSSLGLGKSLTPANYAHWLLAQDYVRQVDRILEAAFNVLIIRVLDRSHDISVEKVLRDKDRYIEMVGSSGISAYNDLWNEIYIEKRNIYTIRTVDEKSSVINYLSKLRAGGR
jgi:hypothetical protein